MEYKPYLKQAKEQVERETYKFKNRIQIIPNPALDAIQVTDEVRAAFKMLNLADTPKRAKPEIQEYEIWLGTYMIQGMSRTSEPELLGKEKGRDFQDACMRFFLKREIENREKADETGEYLNTKQFLYDASRNTYWGTSLYPSKP